MGCNGCLYKILSWVGPPAALFFSIVVMISMTALNEGIPLPLLYLSVQLYTNWYCIYSISKMAKTQTVIGKSSTKSCEIPIFNPTRDDYVHTSLPPPTRHFCNKCFQPAYKPIKHCPACKKCFHFRDHHCFFVGACVIRENMGNFLLICFHTWLACVYSLMTLGPHLYAILNPQTGFIDTVWEFFFPVALGRSLATGDDSAVPLVALFDGLFGIAVMCFGYGVCKLFMCLTGYQKYSPPAAVAVKYTIKEIFGSYGLANFIFPFNGIFGPRVIDRPHQ